MVVDGLNKKPIRCLHTWKASFKLKHYLKTISLRESPNENRSICLKTYKYVTRAKQRVV